MDFYQNMILHLTPPRVYDRVVQQNVEMTIPAQMVGTSACFQTKRLLGFDPSRRGLNN